MQYLFDVLKSHYIQICHHQKPELVTNPLRVLNTTSDQTILVSGISQYWEVSDGIVIGDTEPDTPTDTMTTFILPSPATHATAK